MTHWGYVLLVGYVALGLSPISWRKAGRLATIMTGAVIAYGLHTYGAL